MGSAVKQLKQSLDQQYQLLSCVVKTLKTTRKGAELLDLQDDALIQSTRPMDQTTSTDLCDGGTLTHDPQEGIPNVYRFVSAVYSTQRKIYRFLSTKTNN